MDPTVAEFPSNFATRNDFVDVYRSMVAALADAESTNRWCVIHGDPHLGNLFLDAAGQPSLLDWQLVQRGMWYVDVGYHIASTLTVEDRRASERELLRHYLEQPGRTGCRAAAVGRGLARPEPGHRARFLSVEHHHAGRAGPDRDPAAAHGHRGRRSRRTHTRMRCLLIRQIRPPSPAWYAILGHGRSTFYFDLHKCVP